MRRTRTVVLAVCVLIGAVVAGTGITSALTASAAGPTVKYYACLSSTGALSKVGTTSPVCPKGSSVISWNSTGAKGAPGANGTSVTAAALAVGDATCPTGGVAITDVNGTTPVCNGANGAPGQPGPPGPPGTNGTNGTNGVDGSTILSGGGAPANTVGTIGDYYLDTTGRILYGPKFFACANFHCIQLWPTPGLPLGSAQGTPGPSHVYSAASPGGDTTPFVLGSSERAVVSMTIPAAGTYFISAPVVFLNGDSDYQTDECHLYVNYDGSLSNVLDSASQYLPPKQVQNLGVGTTRQVPSTASETLQGPVYYTGPGYVVLGCAGFNGAVEARLSATLDGGNN